MGLDYTVRGKVLVCHPQGELDEAATSRVAELAASQSPSLVVLDMGGVSYVSSQGVASLLKLQTSLASGKRGLALAAATPLVRRILYQAGVTSAVPIHLTVEEACEEKPP